MPRSSSDTAEPETPPEPVEGAAEDAISAPPADAGGDDGGTEYHSGDAAEDDNGTEYFADRVAEGTAHFVELDRGLYVMTWTGSPDSDRSPLMPTATVLPVTGPARADGPGRKPAVTVERVGEFVFLKVLASKSRVVVLGTSGDDGRSLKLSRLGPAA